jgi:hypothetical protein
MMEECWLQFIVYSEGISESGKNLASKMPPDKSPSYRRAQNKSI